ncbi:ribonuclease H2 subunit B-like [Physella acuta]|uniref:ribonuclease H2 subunit B-like n=1 Tax=Physella acuta TaxID=109671 RepID=UPI0027DB0C79|nr:ribonuclease H2 subunit B-like [Physella acuta]
MPRPTREKSNSEPKKNSKSKAVEKQKDSWIFIINDEVINVSNCTQEAMPTLCKLRHPRLNSGTVYLVSAEHTGIYEVNCFKEKYRSWFFGDTVHSDGHIFLTTPVDPLFLILPYLINAGENKRFMKLDQIVADEDFPDCHKLLTCCIDDQLELVTDWKDIDDSTRVYRYNLDKTLNWLKIKTETLTDVLEEKNVQVSTKGAHSTFFVRSKGSEISKDSYTEYAFGIICDYLPVALEERLKTYLGIPETAENIPTPDLTVENEPPLKKAKVGDLTPTEDYSVGYDLKKDKSKTGKLSAAQKRLSKVDKSGMKSMLSFFSPKS